MHCLQQVGAAGDATCDLHAAHILQRCPAHGCPIHATAGTALSDGDASSLAPTRPTPQLTQPCGRYARAQSLFFSYSISTHKFNYIDLIFFVGLLKHRLSLFALLLFGNSFFKGGQHTRLLEYWSMPASFLDLVLPLKFRSKKIQGQGQFAEPEFSLLCACSSGGATGATAVKACTHPLKPRPETTASTPAHFITVAALAHPRSTVGSRPLRDRKAKKNPAPDRT